MRLPSKSFQFLTPVIFLLFVAPIFGAPDSTTIYLALGDSVPFGYDPTVNPPVPSKYTGYPDIVANVLQIRKNEVNAACPGETSASFIMVGAPDYHCQDFKNGIGLHVNYPGSQLSFALSELQTNRHINLVTLNLGANDLVLLEIACGGPTAPNFAACVGASLNDPVNGVLAKYAQNLGYILTQIRANYSGTLILMNQYAPSADPLTIQAVGALDAVMVQVGSKFGAKFADAFGAFQLASALFQGDPCKAGLLIKTPGGPTPCDVHPTPVGRDLLAATVLIARFGH